MPTVPQVAHALQHLLTTTADEAGRTTGFVQRRSPLTGATFTQTLVFGFLANPLPTLDELTQTAATLGTILSPQALDQRFTKVAANCLNQVLQAAVREVRQASPVAIPVLNRFTAVAIQDSSTIVLPDALAEVWPGCGGRTTTNTTAALKLQVRLDLRTGQLDGPHLQAGRESDHTPPFAPLPVGALRIADLGYWSVPDFATLSAHGGYWLSRLQAATAVYDATGQRQDVVALLTQHLDSVCDIPIQLGAEVRLPARLLAYRVPQEVADQRRRRLRQEARRKGKRLTAARLALAGWTLLVTNVPAAQLSAREAAVLARSRWQIELLFKLWKTVGQIDESRSAKPWRQLCEIYAKLITVVIQHWGMLVGCWTIPNRSLTKAARTIQHHAFHLASSLHDRNRLEGALTLIQSCLQAGCRMNRRKRAPNTYQLLLGEADDSLA